MESRRIACTPSLGKERTETTEALALRQKGINAYQVLTKKEPVKIGSDCALCKGPERAQPAFSRSHSHSLSLSLSPCLSVSLFLSLSCSFYPAAKGEGVGGGGVFPPHIGYDGIHSAADGHGA